MFCRVLEVAACGSNFVLVVLQRVGVYFCLCATRHQGLWSGRGGRVAISRWMTAVPTVNIWWPSCTTGQVRTSQVCACFTITCLCRQSGLSRRTGHLFVSALSVLSQEHTFPNSFSMDIWHCKRHLWWRIASIASRRASVIM